MSDHGSDAGQNQPTVHPTGLWRWDGTRWVPNASSSSSPPPPPSSRPWYKRMHWLGWVVPAVSVLIIAAVAVRIAVGAGNRSGPKPALFSAVSSPSSEPATTETSTVETPVTPEASSPAQPITSTMPGSIDVTMTDANGDTIHATVKVAHLGTFQHTTVPYGEDPANGYFVAFVVNESSKSDGFDFGGTLDFYVVVKGVHYDSDNGHVLGSGRADAELAPVTLNAGESTHGTVTFDLSSTHGRLYYLPVYQGTPLAVWTF
jgi:hypothetical protein